MAILLATGRFGKICADLYCIFETREQLRAYIESWGAWAPVALVFVQALQVVIAPIPGELTGTPDQLLNFTDDFSEPVFVHSNLGLAIRLPEKSHLVERGGRVLLRSPMHSLHL